jgi:hypothetical protein
MYYEPSREQQAIRQQAKACHQALVDLEARAGIAEAAEKARNEPPNYFSVYDAAEPHSDEQRELEAFEEQAQQRRATRRLRTLYFAVPDGNLRKELIARHREEGDLPLRFWREEVSDAARRLTAAQSAGKHWWVAASVCGIGRLGLGFYLFGMVGALGGLIVGYFSGRSLEQSALRTRQTAVEEAERELRKPSRMGTRSATNRRRFRYERQTPADPIKTIAAPWPVSKAERGMKNLELGERPL